MTDPGLVATYRVQLRAEFGFRDAAAIADYLAALGVSHLYSSPALQAAPGSTHGYDSVDPHRVSEELGGGPGWEALCARLRELGLGLVLDVVPNHMAISHAAGNRWWWDVLENGPASRYARYFDVDWDPPETKLRNLVLVPVLGDHYGRVLDAGEIRVVREDGRVVVRYAEHVLPVAPPTLDDLCTVAAARAGSDDLAAIGDALAALPTATATDAASVLRRHRGKEWLRDVLARLCAEQPAVAAALDAELAELNADHERLHAFLERQNYRLAYWRTASRELGYRRFFDITTLVGLRAEDPQVFADTHALIVRWLADGMLDGVRVDHPDGLRDPQAYFQRLRDAGPAAWIVAEKILEPGEHLPASWPIDGTTGYEFTHRAGGLFVDRGAEAALTAIYTEFTGEPADYHAIAHAAKHAVLREALATDVNRLTALLVEICERHPRQRDYTRHELHEAIREVVAGFPVYRTYVRAAAAEVTGEDVHAVQLAVAAATGHRPDLDPELFAFLGDLLLLRIPGDVERELAMRLQQLTGPAMAKGIEDTACYRYNRFAAANEVGGNPGRLGVTVEEFHTACVETQGRWPRTMLATSTHDTKRSEDVRARLSLLSQMPDRWRQAVEDWAAHNARHRTDEWPDRNTEYLYYQTLVGAWPIDAGRAWPYMEKAIREAKVHTSWTRPHERYEAAVRAFVEGTLADAAFTAALAAFVEPLIEPGRITSLAQVALKLTAPGVPDFYQGSEIWDHSLVDPDNRRPVDYAARRGGLAALEGATPEQVRACSDEGGPKLWLIRQGLALRRAAPACFGPEGTYRGLAARGRRAAHVVAFTRAERVVTVVPRLVLDLDDWADTTIELPAGHWHDWLTGDPVRGGTVPVAELLTRFPVALLATEEAMGARTNDRAQ